MNKSKQDPTNLNLLQGKHPTTRLENASNQLNRQERTYADEWIVMKGDLPKKHVLWEETTGGISQHSSPKKKKKKSETLEMEGFFYFYLKNHPDESRRVQPLTAEKLGVFPAT